MFFTIFVIIKYIIFSHKNQAYNIFYAFLLVLYIFLDQTLILFSVMLSTSPTSDTQPTKTLLKRFTWTSSKSSSATSSGSPNSSTPTTLRSMRRPSGWHATPTTGSASRSSLRRRRRASPRPRRRSRGRSAPLALLTRS